MDVVDETEALQRFFEGKKYYSLKKKKKFFVMKKLGTVGTVSLLSCWNNVYKVTLRGKISK